MGVPAALWFGLVCGGTRVSACQVCKWEKGFDSMTRLVQLSETRAGTANDVAGGMSALAQHCEMVVLLRAGALQPEGGGAERRAARAGAGRRPGHRGSRGRRGRPLQPTSKPAGVWETGCALLAGSVLGIQCPW